MRNKINQILSSNLHALLWREERWYVNECIELQLASQGKTKPEALKNLEEAIELYLEDEKVVPPKGYSDIELHNLSDMHSYA
ncbi:hypothetical protein A3D77_01285 [Candidatus Gottesmanbacteria bacterium RIFCSPHIGHO2_02_FULL_39_11]|uniref:HicB-like antitoxin of toxin-antitoxin system domain-containing protein n=1 Tax=Candidatus Gottesmanbacteria bacterium RIFCSPHIGHO2_02_FULL_39_11 TaxID=1798382 RepID=A0A1F5ZTE5_9BACT|nr:MAG: hypothetical protein A3D77_01285 [Candidatus Gottesmanbacteria bacterium RIFCSPHIGHO2_02_FULL_39_11]